MLKIDASYSVYSRFGDFGIDLKALSELGYFSKSSFGDISDRIFSQVHRKVSLEMFILMFR